MAPVATPVAPTKTATTKASAVETATGEMSTTETTSAVETATGKASRVEPATAVAATAPAVATCPSGVSQGDRYDAY
jgi:hypothetical protein